jgi:hypothetical protein
MIKDVEKRKYMRENYRSACHALIIDLGDVF